MLYIIPIHAHTIKDAIQVNSELDVADYYLTKDDNVTAAQRVAHAVFSDSVLNLLVGLIGFYPKELYLRYIYGKLKKGMYSNFCWGDESLAKKYFA